MKTFYRVITFFIVFWASSLLNAATTDYRSIEWVDLIPKSDLKILLNPPESISQVPHGLSESGVDQLSGSVMDLLNKNQKPLTPEEQAYSAALQSTGVNQEYDGTNIRLPGYIVPLEYNDDLVITEFFLVPYFGACIHVPPPPPNQIIYVKYPQGITLEALYDPFWIEGAMQTTLVENDLATSAYTVTAAAVKPYINYQK